MKATEILASVNDIVDGVARQFDNHDPEGGRARVRQGCVQLRALFPQAKGEIDAIDEACAKVECAERDAGPLRKLFGERCDALAKRLATSAPAGPAAPAGKE